MTKRKPVVKLESYGIYTPWDKNSKELPRILEFTRNVPATENTEFGYILNIKKAKGKRVKYRIIHPEIKDENGNNLPDFEGEYYIHSNDFRFFIGDCIWPPPDDKTGTWRIITQLDNQVIADEVFIIIK